MKELFARALAVLALLALLPFNSPSQTTDQRDPDELDALNNALGDLGGTRLDPEEEDKTKRRLRADLKQLRDDLDGLQQTVDEKLRAITELEDENRKLRQALRLRYGSDASNLPPVPMPNRDLIEDVLNDPAVQRARDALVRPPEPPSGDSGPAADVAYAVVGEWGRSPETAASLRGNVSSLIGLSVSVGRGAREDGLRKLGRELRETYEAYDNINIEVFDNDESARAYADQGTVDKAHRVLSVSKHKHSERDVIHVYRNGAAIKVR